MSTDLAVDLPKQVQRFAFQFLLRQTLWVGANQQTVLLERQEPPYHRGLGCYWYRWFCRHSCWPNRVGSDSFSRPGRIHERIQSQLFGIKNKILSWQA